MTETLLETMTKESPASLIIPLGMNVAGEVVVLDLLQSGNILINSPKSMLKDTTLIKSIITSCLSKNLPYDLRLIITDVGKAGLNIFDGIDHLLTPVINVTEKVISAHQWIQKEIDRRMALFERTVVDNIREYNQVAGYGALEYILVVNFDIVEMMKQAPSKLLEMMNDININAQKAGIIFIATTSQPRAKVCDNYKTKIAFKSSYGSKSVDYRVTGADILVKVELNQMSEEKISEIINSCHNLK